jgi:hypothetical protein
MSKRGSLRTVTSARPVTKAASSLVSSLPRAGIQPDGVAGQGGMGLVTVQLRPLVLMDRVLHRQGVEPKLLRERRKVLMGWLAQIEPHHAALLLEVVGDLGDGKSLASSTPLR